jgi:hypothetical protein
MKPAILFGCEVWWPARIWMAKAAKTIVQRLGGHAERTQPPGQAPRAPMDADGDVIGLVRDGIASISGGQGARASRSFQR